MAKHINEALSLITISMEFFESGLGYGMHHYFEDLEEGAFKKLCGKNRLISYLRC